MKALLIPLFVLTLWTPVRAQDHPGRLAWAAVLGSVATYELWATATHHETMSQAVQHGPRWVKVSVGVGLVALSLHLYVGSR